MVTTALQERHDFPGVDRIRRKLHLDVVRRCFYTVIPNGVAAIRKR